MKTLLNQLKHIIKINNIKKQTISSLFIGGGTPSSVSDFLYQDIFEYLSDFLIKNAEITSEINPSVKTNWIDSMMSYGVNRFSMGVQSFNKDKLKFLGRAHNNKMTLNALEHLKSKNVDFSIDLIYDVSGDNKNILLNDLSYVKSFEIKHLSAYSLMIESKTKFENKYDYKLNDDTMALWFIDEIKKLDLSPYEISNFANKKEHQSTHNMGYWKKEDYLGVGSGAIGCIGNNRFYNQNDVAKYIDDYSFEKIEILNEDDIRLEKIFLGLRSIVGVDLSIIKNKEKVEILVNENKLNKKNNRIYSNDFFLADEICLYLE